MGQATIHDQPTDILSQTAFSPNTPNAITPRRVKIALDALLYGRSIAPSDSLEQLTLVNEVLAAAALPPDAHSRAAALGILLTALMTKELVKHRRAMGIHDSLTKIARQAALEAIARDGQCANPELLGWSWLYYHYVRVELNIQPKDFCQACFVTERTLRRYQALAFWRLTQLLIKREWQICRARNVANRKQAL